MNEMAYCHECKGMRHLNQDGTCEDCGVMLR